MKFSAAFLLFLFFFNGVSTGQEKRSKQPNTLVATDMKPFGRFAINEDKSLELISSAVHFGFSFEGPECKIYAWVSNPDEHNYLQYTLDGVYQKKIRISGGSAAPYILKVPSGKHTVWVYKATEAHTGPVFIRKVEGNKIKAVQVAKAPLIEFIGNSITCGAAADPSEVPCGTGVYHDQHNAFMAYGPRVARDLNANYVLSSVSGIGAYRTWNTDGPSMPEVYEKLDFQVKGTRLWDFKTYTPAIVSIALGTNDLSNGDGKQARKPFDADTFVNHYVKFVQLIKSKYPKADIALLSSPMIKGESREILESCLKSIKIKVDALYPADKPVATFFFKAMEAHGCSGHPNVADHLILAQQLKPFFKGLLEGK